MATQHPDNAFAPWWSPRNDPFVSTQDEISELITLFKELPIDEYMWDWEGKYVDEAVGEKIYSQASDFLAAHPLAKDFHLTFRIPAFDGEKMHRMARAFMNVLSLADLAQEVGAPEPPVQEMFLPLTTSADQLRRVRETFLRVAEYHSDIFHGDEKRHPRLLSRLRVTPLVEDVDSMFEIEKILRPYWSSVTQTADPGELAALGQRVFLARSDPALNAGLVPAVLAIRCALSTAADLGRELGFAVHPIIGTGSLPFRGSVSPDSIDHFIDQYAGVRTYTIQSSFRYDHEKQVVYDALARMKKIVPTKEVIALSLEESARIRAIASVFVTHWRPSVEALAPLINRIAAFVPNRRERLLHIGLFGYSRSVGEVSLPRAIKFTGALYSYGIPPELIATGRGLRIARENGDLEVLERQYPAIRHDLMLAGCYLNKDNVARKAKNDPVWKDILADIAGIEEYLGEELGPVTPQHMIHRNITSNIAYRLEGDFPSEDITADIVEAAQIRRSIG